MRTGPALAPSDRREADRAGTGEADPTLREIGRFGRDGVALAVEDDVALRQRQDDAWTERGEQDGRAAAENEAAFDRALGGDRARERTPRRDQIPMEPEHRGM